MSIPTFQLIGASVANTQQAAQGQTPGYIFTGHMMNLIQTAGVKPSTLNYTKVHYDQAVLAGITGTTVQVVSHTPGTYTISGKNYTQQIILTTEGTTTPLTSDIINFFQQWNATTPPSTVFKLGIHSTKFASIATQTTIVTIPTIPATAAQINFEIYY